MEEKKDRKKVAVRRLESLKTSGPVVIPACAAESV